MRICDKMGIPVKEGKPEIPVRKEVMVLTTTPSLGVSMLYIYFLSVMTSNSSVFSKLFISWICEFGLSFFNCYIFCPYQKTGNPVKLTIINKILFCFLGELVLVLKMTFREVRDRHW
jgi:hypothetical protein